MVVKARKLAELIPEENVNRVRSKDRIWGSGHSEFRKWRGSSRGTEKEQPVQKENRQSEGSGSLLERVCQALRGALSGKSPHQLLASALRCSWYIAERVLFENIILLL